MSSHNSNTGTGIINTSTGTIRDDTSFRIVQLSSNIFIFSCTYMAIHCVVERILFLYYLDYCSRSSRHNRSKKTKERRLLLLLWKKELIISLSKLIPGWPFLFGLGMKSFFVWCVYSLKL